MERNREARRMVNGGLSSSSSSSRRRQRTSSSSLRDSPDEDGGMELQETRLRERGKKERDRDRSGRSKRRRVERGAMMLAMHGGVGGGREDGEDTSEDSAEDDEEDDYEDATAPQQQQQQQQQMVRLPPPPPLPPGNPSALQNQSSSSLNHHHHNHHHNQQQQQQQQHHNQHQHQHQHHHQQQHRKGVVAAAPKAPRVTGVWKAAADEMIGVSVPRKARTASAKRSPECWVSGSGSGREGGGGTGGGVLEAVHRQPSTSPARPSPSSSAPISPSSSNASIKKKVKTSRENKHRPPKISKPPSSSVQDIEFEVAEVLFGMTRQFPGPPKHETIHKSEPKEPPNGSGNNEAKSRVSSPNSISASPAPPQPQPLPLPLQPNAALTSGVVAPKRKRPRPIKPEEENPASPLNPATLAPSVLPPGKVEEEQNPRADLPQAKPEKMPALADKMPGLAVENGVAAPEDLHPPQEASAPTDAQKEMIKMEVDKVSESKPSEVEVEARERVEAKDERAKQAPRFEDVKQDEASEKKVSPPAESAGKEKFEIDLMAPPPGKPSPEDEAMEEFGVDRKVMVPEETGKKVEKMEVERKDETAKMDREGSGLEPKVEVKSALEEMDLRKMPSKERIFELQLEIPKQGNKDEASNSRQQQPQRQPLLHQQQQPQHQQSKPPRADLKSEKSVQPGASSLQMNAAGWHGGLPPFGYMGQVPSLVPMDGSTGPAKPMQAPHVLVPPQRPRRCATHCYIAQCIENYQQLQQLSRLWPAAAGATAFFGAKSQYNVNGLQPTDSVAMLGNTLQGGGLPGRNISSLQDMGNPVVAAFGGLAAKDKNPMAVNASLDSSQRKQLLLQQTPQGVSANNMLTPAFVFPFNQQQAAVAAAAAFNRPGAVAKSGGGASATTPLTSAPVGSSALPASGASNVSFNYPNLPPGEAPYVAILQNNAYPFTIPAAHVGAPPQFRANNAQAMPFFGSSFYPSQMLHPSQLQQQQPPTQQQQSQQATTTPSCQQGHQNKSTSSGSSSSQKHQQQRVHGSVSGAPPSHGFPTMKLPQHLLTTGRPTEAEIVSEDTPSSADSRGPSAHKGLYSHNFTVPVHPQNIALMSSTSDKQTHMPPSSQNSPSQAFTVSFPSLNGVTPPLGIDFSTSQNHHLFQSIPEGARQGYQMAPAAAVTAATQPAHQKKSEGKPCPEPTEEERKAMLATKSPVNFSQHSLAFAATSPSLSNSAVEGSSRAVVNMIQPPSGSRSSIRPASTAPSSAAAGGAAASFGTHQQQQQPLIVLQQLQRQQQQNVIQHQHLLASRPKTTSTPTSSPTLYTPERLVSTSAVPKFPNPLGGFPQPVVVQGRDSGAAAAAAASQANQWKNATRSSVQVPIPSQAQSTIPSSNKNQATQQQGRGAPQTSSLPNQTQISFSVAAGVGNTQKLQQQSGANGASNSSPQPSVSKGGGGSNGGGSGSPRSSTISKQGPPLSATLPLQQQPLQSKSSPVNSGLKSSPVSSGRNAPSILGQPHIAPPPQGSSSKQQIEQMQHFQQAQLYFSPQLQANPVAQAYFQTRQQQQQQQSPSQQPSLVSTSTGVLSLCPPALTLGGASATTDLGKSAAVPNMKNIPPQNLLHAQLAAAAQRPLMSAPGFPYVHAISSVSVKSAEQKPAAGNDNLHACWQPEKR